MLYFAICLCFVSIAAATLAGIDIMNEIIIVLSDSRNASGSEDVKSALLELIKLARTSDRQYIVKIKSLLPNVIETLKHPEVILSNCHGTFVNKQSSGVTYEFIYSICHLFKNIA